MCLTILLKANIKPNKNKIENIVSTTNNAWMMMMMNDENNILE